MKYEGNQQMERRSDYSNRMMAGTASVLAAAVGFFAGEANAQTNQAAKAKDLLNPPVPAGQVTTATAVPKSNWDVRGSARYGWDLASDNGSGDITFKKEPTDTHHFSGLSPKLSGIDLAVEAQKRKSPWFFGVDARKYNGKGSSNAPTEREDDFDYRTEDSIERSLTTFGVFAGRDLYEKDGFKLRASLGLGPCSVSDDFRSITDGTDIHGSGARIHSEYGSSLDRDGFYGRLRAEAVADISKKLGLEPGTVRVGAGVGLTGYSVDDPGKMNGQANGTMYVDGKAIPPNKPGDSNPSTDENDSVEFSTARPEVSAGILVDLGRLLGKLFR